jgi:hypothetical protein
MSTAFAFDDVRRPTPIATASYARMSGTRGATALAPEPEFEPQTTEFVGSGGLEVVPERAARRARPRVLAVTGLVAGVGCVLAGQLFLSIQSASGAYAVTQLQQTSTSLARQQQVATEQLERLSAPQNLARDAQALGMVPSTASAAIRVSNGKVVGAAASSHGATVSTRLVPDALLSGLSTPAR